MEGRLRVKPMRGDDFASRNRQRVTVYLRAGGKGQEGWQEGLNTAPVARERKTSEASSLTLVKVREGVGTPRTHYCHEKTLKASQLEGGPLRLTIGAEPERGLKL